MKRLWFAMLAIALVCVSLPMLAQEQEPDWNSVQAFVTYQKKIGYYVWDKKEDRYVDTMPQDRFRISENIKKRGWTRNTVKSVFSGQNGLLVVQALDFSGSLKAYLGEIRASGQNFLTVGIKTEKDKVLLLPFGIMGLRGGIFLDDSRQFTNNTEKLMKDIEKIHGDGATPLFDSLLVAVRRLDAEGALPGNEDFRKVIILATDGQENLSTLSTECDIPPARATKEEIAEFRACKEAENIPKNRIKAYERKKKYVEDVLFQANIPIYVLYTGSDEMGTAPLISDLDNPGHPLGNFGKAQYWLSTLARNTGGRYFRFQNSQDRQKAFTQISAELSHKYWMLFNPADPLPGELAREYKVEIVKIDDAGRPAVDKKGKELMDDRYKVIILPKKFFF